MASGLRRRTAIKAGRMSAAALLEGEPGHAGGHSVQTRRGMISPVDFFSRWEKLQDGAQTPPKIIFMLFLQPAGHGWGCCSFQEII